MEIEVTKEKVIVPFTKSGEKFQGIILDKNDMEEIIVKINGYDIFSFFIKEDTFIHINRFYGNKLIKHTIFSGKYNHEKKILILSLRNDWQ